MECWSSGWSFSRQKRDLPVFSPGWHPPVKPGAVFACRRVCRCVSSAARRTTVPRWSSRFGWCDLKNFVVQFIFAPLWLTWKSSWILSFWILIRTLFWGKRLYWMFPKIMVLPNHPFVHRVFHYFHHPFWVPLFLETSIFWNRIFFNWNQGVFPRLGSQLFSGHISVAHLGRIKNMVLEMKIWKEAQHWSLNRQNVIHFWVGKS